MALDESVVVAGERRQRRKVGQTHVGLPVAADFDCLAVDHVLDSSDWTTGALMSMVNGAERIWMASNNAVTKSTWMR